MKFSLIVATLGRDRELTLLLESLLTQTMQDFEVILVDQNDDDRLSDVVAAYAPRLVLQRLRFGRRNASAARNLGLLRACGEIVGFPDDDCCYPPAVLEYIATVFAADPELTVLTGPAASPHGELGSGRWRRQSGLIDLATVWTSVIEFNLFLRREAALALGGFDENMGPGTIYASAEGNDLVCRALARGFKARYDFHLRIMHPDKRRSDIALERAEAYGRGLGLALRRHRTSAVTRLTFLIRPVGGVVVSLLCGRLRDAAYFWRSLRGRLQGMLAPPSLRHHPATAIASPP